MIDTNTSTPFERDTQFEQVQQQMSQPEAQPAVAPQKMPFWVMLLNPGRALGGYWLFMGGTLYNGFLTGNESNVIFFGIFAGFFLWMYLASKSKKHQYAPTYTDFTKQQKSAKYRNWIVLSIVSFVAAVFI